MKPAPILRRVEARLLDASIAGVVFASLSLAVVLFFSAADSFIAIGGATGSGSSSWNDYLEIALYFLAALVVAAGTEPYMLCVRYLTLGSATTSGKARAGVEIHVADRLGELASRGRALGRYLVSVGACAATGGVSIAVAGAVGVGLMPPLVVGLVAASCLTVWLSVLLSALLRSDRRGWHDLVTGTMLVSRSVSPPHRGIRYQGWDQGAVDRAR